MAQLDRRTRRDLPVVGRASCSTAVSGAAVAISPDAPDFGDDATHRCSPHHPGPPWKPSWSCSSWRFRRLHCAAGHDRWTSSCADRRGSHSAVIRSSPIVVVERALRSLTTLALGFRKPRRGISGRGTWIMARLPARHFDLPVYGVLPAGGHRRDQWDWWPLIPLAASIGLNI